MVRESSYNHNHHYHARYNFVNNYTCSSFSSTALNCGFDSNYKTQLLNLCSNPIEFTSRFFQYKLSGVGFSPICIYDLITVFLKEDAMFC